MRFSVIRDVYMAKKQKKSAIHVETSLRTIGRGRETPEVSTDTVSTKGTANDTGLLPAQGGKLLQDFPLWNNTIIQ